MEEKELKGKYIRILKQMGFEDDKIRIILETELELFDYEEIIIPQQLDAKEISNYIKKGAVFKIFPSIGQLLVIPKPKQEKAKKIIKTKGE